MKKKNYYIIRCKMLSDSSVLYYEGISSNYVGYIYGIRMSLYFEDAEKLNSHKDAENLIKYLYQNNLVSDDTEMRIEEIKVHSRFELMDI